VNSTVEMFEQVSQFNSTEQLSKNQSVGFRPLFDREAKLCTPPIRPSWQPLSYRCTEWAKAK